MTIKRDRDARRADWLEQLVKGISDEIKKTAKGRAGEEFSVFMVPVLQMALSTQGKLPGRFGGWFLPLGTAADELGISWYVMRRYLKAAAQAGILKGVTWYDESLKHRAPLEVVPNPTLIEACGTTRLSDAKELGRVFGQTWLERRNAGEELQGFGEADEAPWGRFSRDPGGREAAKIEKASSPIAIPEPVRRDEMANRIKAAAQGKKTSQALKRQENEDKRRLVNAFVQGAATVWVTMRSRAGFGTEPPAWAGPPGSLPPAARQERNEITRQFGIYGGQKAAVAWALFCGSKAALDKNGKRVYDPDRAFQQNASADKKPRVYSSNITQLLDEAKRIGWFEKEDVLTRLRSAFGDSFDAGPTSAPTVGVVSKPKQETSHGDQAATGTEGGGNPGLGQREAPPEL